MDHNKYDDLNQIIKKHR
ncbi:hypothetical protein [Borreliella burgdorferi]